MGLLYCIAIRHEHVLLYFPSHSASVDRSISINFYLIKMKPTLIIAVISRYRSYLLKLTVNLNRSIDKYFSPLITNKEMWKISLSCSHIVNSIFYGFSWGSLKRVSVYCRIRVKISHRVNLKLIIKGIHAQLNLT